MRVVEPHDLETEIARVTPRGNMSFGIDQETPGRVVGQVRGGDRADDVGGCADQHPAAFVGQRRQGVRADPVEGRSSETNRYKASTAMAIPIPPPIQSDATP